MSSAIRVQPSTPIRPSRARASSSWEVRLNQGSDLGFRFQIREDGDPVADLDADIAAGHDETFIALDGHEQRPDSGQAMPAT